MPIEILMPALSPTMTEGNLARWLKKEGDEVHAGDVIAEIETDKATMEYEAVDEGRIGKIIVPEGAQGIKVNAADRGAARRGRGRRPRLPMSERRAGAGSAGGGGRSRRNRRVAAAVRPDRKRRQPRTPALPASGEREGPAPARRVRGSGRRHAATARPASSPARWRAAWRMHAGLDLAAIRGSGPQGRIVKADIERALAQPARHAGRSRPRPRGRRSRGDRRRVRPPPPSAASAPVFAKEQVLALAGNPPYTREAAHRDAPGHRPPARRSRSRPSRISTCRSIARSTNC